LLNFFTERKEKMVHEENKLNYGIKGKLISAIAMLLVAVIMVVSSTYAWFTLSTAPEVSGINTAVGANGALEMLLLTHDTDGNPIYKNGEVDGGIDRNTYWGNLVDLATSATQNYGADKITLYPSILKTADGKIVLETPILTPKYGSDGRVDSLNPGGLFGKYNGTNFMPVDSANSLKETGFRALGVSSGLSERQQAFRAALGDLSTAQSAALKAARDSLSANGTALAAIAVQKAMKGANAKYSDADVLAVESMVTGLEEALKKVEDAYIQAAILAVLSSNNSDADDVAFTSVNAIKAAAAASTNVNARLTAVMAISGMSDIVEAFNGYGVYTQALSSLNTSKSKLANMTTTWETISPVLTPLVNVETIMINGIPAKDVSSEDNKNKIAGDILGGKGVKVNIPTGGGVYADVADLCGDYTVDVEIKSDDLNVGVTNVTIKAKMTADSTLETSHLSALKTASSANAPTSSSGSQPLSELYGYVIDLAFRTNAAQSDLLLQGTAKDRIYSDNNNTETMGHGSTMTFKTDATDFTAENMKSLMRHIRVVFFNPADGSIYAEARLDTANAVTTADGLTATICIAETVDNTTTLKTNGKIVSLNQNTPMHVSALVYIDGSTIENKDVAATVASSMYGTVNFQFASSAELVPMQYGDLYTPGTGSTESSAAESSEASGN
jgi:hypothetical protein